MTDTNQSNPSDQPNAAENQSVTESENAGAVQNVAQDSKNMALLGWIGAMFFGFIPGLILYLVKKDDAFVAAHAKENLNFSITLLISYIVSSVLMAVLIGFVLILLVWVANMVFCIIAAMKASKGEMYQVPYILRLIK